MVPDAFFFFIFRSQQDQEEAHEEEKTFQGLLFLDEADLLLLHYCKSRGSWLSNMISSKKMSKKRTSWSLRLWSWQPFVLGFFPKP